MQDRKKILIIGDTIVDLYASGDVSRISPEAPVPILDLVTSRKEPGGAANVTLNVHSLLLNPEETDVFYFGFYDNFIRNIFAEKKINLIGVPIGDDHMLTKTRYVCRKQQLLRVDNKKQFDNQHLLLVLENKFCQQDLSKYDLIIISDYNKGTLTEKIWKHVTDSGVLCLMDLKTPRPYFGGLNFNNVVLKCNKEEKDKYGYKLGAAWFKAWVITMGKDGYKIITSNENDYPALNLDDSITDVTGAGDVYLAAMAVYFLENEYDIEKMCEFANKAAGEKVKHFGTTVVKRKDLHE